MKLFSLIIFLLILTHCSHSEYSRRLEFESIKMGMVKSEVLDSAGPPHWSDRNKGMDRWFYYLEPGDRQTEKVVYFKEGRVFRKGLRDQPLLTAEEAEEIKRPKVPLPKPFKPSMTEKQLRKAIKKEIKKNKRHKRKSQYETL